MHSASFLKTEAIDSPRIAPERESPRLMEPLETMSNQQGWDQPHGPSDRRIKGWGWGGTRRGAGMLWGRSTPDFGGLGLGRCWQMEVRGAGALGEEEICTCLSPHTMAASHPLPPTRTLALSRVLELGSPFPLPGPLSSPFPFPL